MVQEFFVLTETLSNSCLHVNREPVEKPVKSRRLARVDYEFTPVPETIEREIEKAALERLFRILLRFYRRGVTDPSMRQLAHAMRKGVRQVQRYIRELVALGKLLVTARRVARDRNNTNVYTLTNLAGGVGVRSDVEKRGEVLTTTTPATARGSVVKPAKSNEALQWALRKAHDALDALRMRGEYADRGKLWFELQQRRLNQAYERTSRAMVGVYVPKPPTPEQEREWEVVEAGR
jgi:hypothetical protein